MPAPDVVRKLSGLRLALEFYRQERRTPPPSYAAVMESGKLEEVPRLKLKGHRTSSRVADVKSFLLRDTGGWAYVNAAGPDFGLVYIDCTHFDEKGRPWSEF